MSEDSLFQEVDEELRRDRMRALARRFGPYVVGVIVLVVIAVAGNEGWRWYQGNIAAQSSDKYYSANELAVSGDTEGALKALGELEASGSGGYPTLAKFRSAGVLAKEGRTEEAIAVYDDLATSASEPRLRDLALLLAAYASIDGGNPAAVISRVSGFDVPGNAFEFAAKEATGLAYYAAKDPDAAYAAFSAIVADAAAPRELTSRVQVYIAQLLAEGVKPKVSEAASTSADDEAAAPEKAN